MRPVSLKVKHHHTTGLLRENNVFTSAAISQFYVGSASCFPILLGITFVLWSNFHAQPLIIAASVCVGTGRVGLLMTTQHEWVITKC